MYFFANKIVTINPTYFQSLKKFFNDRVVYIPNPVSNIFTKKKIYKEYKNQIFKIGMASRINTFKHHKLIIDTVNKISKNNIKIICEFAGDGELKTKLIEYVQTLNLKTKVKFIGILNESNLRNWLNSLNLYVQATKGEGMSTSVLQALSSKTLVLGSDVCGNNDILEKSKFVGKLFKNNILDLEKKIMFFYFLKKKNKEKYLKAGTHYINKNHHCNLVRKKYFYLINNL